MIKRTLANTSLWLYMLKYFFEIIVKKPSLDKNLVILTWKKLYELLKIMPTTSIDKRTNFLNELHADEEEEYAHANFVELQEFFLHNTIEYLEKFQTAAKQSDNTVPVEVVKTLLAALVYKENSVFLEDE